MKANQGRVWACAVDGCDGGPFTPAEHLQHMAEEHLGKMGWTRRIKEAGR